MGTKEEVTKGLHLLHSSFTSKLGRREQYLGASDLVACPRKVYYSKVSEDSPVSDVQTAVFARGYIAEELVVRALTAVGERFKTQVEYPHPSLEYVTCHCDIVFEDTSSIRIIEVKSGVIPNAPHPAHSKQLQIQMLLAGLNNPDKVISGEILYFDVKTGDIFCFEDCKPVLDLDKFNSKAAELWGAIQSKTPPKGLYNDFCNNCPYKEGCEALLQEQFVFCEDILERIKDLKNIKAEQKRLAKLEEDIKEAIDSVPDGKYNIDADTVLVISTSTRHYLQNKLVLEKYPELNDDQSFWKHNITRTVTVK